MKHNINDFAEVFRALGDDNRLMIMSLLAKQKVCASDLLKKFSFSQPTLSYHMKMLVRCGLVTAEKEGKRTYYCVQQNWLKRLKSAILAVENVGKTRVARAG